VRFRAVVVLLVAVLLLMPLLAKGGCCDAAETDLQRWLTEHHDPSPATIAAFDHVERTWSIYSWDGSSLKLIEGPKEKPEIALGRGDSLRTVIVNTNPLIFRADRSNTAETNIEALENLQKLATGLGGLAGFVFQSAGEKQSDRSKKLLIAMTPETKRQEVEGVLQQGQVLQALAKSTVTLTLDQAAIFELKENFLRAVQVQLGKFAGKKIFETIAKESMGLGNVLDGGKEEILLAWLQAVEVDAKPLPAAPAFTNLSDLATKFEAIRSASMALEASKPTCSATVGTVAEMVMIKRTPLVGVGSAERSDTFSKSALALLTGPAEPGCDEEIVKVAKELVQWLQGHGPDATGPTDPLERAVFEDLTEGVAPYLELTAKFTKVLADAKALVEKQSAATLATARVNQFLDRLSKSSPTKGCLLCNTMYGILEVKRSSFSGKDIAWSKVRKDTVTVALDEGLKGKLTLSHPESAEGSFEVHRRFTENLGVDFGLVKTDLSEPSYEAKSVDGTPGSLLKIQEKDRTTRSGKLGLFASYRFPIGHTTAISFGPQIGVGADTSDAAFFLGGSLRIGFLSLGVGSTWQKAKRLNGQEPGQLLPAGEVVKTEDRFKSKTYFSLMISIKDLPFFKPSASK